MKKVKTLSVRLTGFSETPKTSRAIETRVARTLKEIHPWIQATSQKDGLHIEPSIGKKLYYQIRWVTVGPMGMSAPILFLGSTKTKNGEIQIGGFLTQFGIVRAKLVEAH